MWKYLRCNVERFCILCFIDYSYWVFSQIFSVHVKDEERDENFARKVCSAADLAWPVNQIDSKYFQLPKFWESLF